jgi:hypothetical protein
MTPMQQLLNQMREERTKLSMPIEWDRCYQAIEMMIENTYLPMEHLPQQEISDEEIEEKADEFEFTDGIYGFKQGVKWYKEQLKQRL